jgi:hypothetical protein
MRLHEVLMTQPHAVFDTRDSFSLKVVAVSDRNHSPLLFNTKDEVVRILSTLQLPKGNIS